MEYVIAVSFGFSFLAIPVGLTATAIRAYDGTNGFKLLAKLVISLIGFLPLSLFALALLIGVFANDSSPGAQVTESAKLFGAVVVYLYLLSGYMLCCFINGGFIKPWLALRARSKPNVLGLN